MDFRIVDVFTQDGLLVVRAQHFKPDGSAWFTEHYTWQGREGLKQKRQTNALGQLLLNDDTVAPERIKHRGPPEEMEQFLPEGRAWKLLPGPHMVEESILSVIRSIHQQRLASGYPDRVDQLRTPKHTAADDTGCPALLTKFRGLLGRVV